MENVWVEFDEGTGKAIRIFKSEKASWAAASPARLWSRKGALQDIRNQVFYLQKGQCRNCPARMTKRTMHLHERIHRGRGGEISLENSVGLCSACHIGVRGEHSNRAPRWARKDIKQ